MTRARVRSRSHGSESRAHVHARTGPITVRTGLHNCAHRRRIRSRRTRRDQWPNVDGRRGAARLACGAGSRRLQFQPPGDWCNGNMGVSKTLARGSIPRSPVSIQAAQGGSSGDAACSMFEVWSMVERRRRRRGGRVSGSVLPCCWCAWARRSRCCWARGRISSAQLGSVVAAAARRELRRGALLTGCRRLSMPTLKR
jgi:hypothetical protein